MTVYAIGATSLIGGGAGALDAEYVDANGTPPWSAVGETPGIHDGDPAFVTVAGDKVYHFIADATSGAEPSPPNVIKPVNASAGVPYTGDLRWILHAAYAIEDGNNAGDIIRWNAATEAWESCAEPLDFTQINLTPQSAAVENTEGGVFYKSTDKSVYICTERRITHGYLEEIGIRSRCNSEFDF